MSDNSLQGWPRASRLQRAWQWTRRRLASFCIGSPPTRSTTPSDPQSSGISPSSTRPPHRDALRYRDVPGPSSEHLLPLEQESLSSSISQSLESLSSVSFGHYTGDNHGLPSPEPHQARDLLSTTPPVHRSPQDHIPVLGQDFFRGINYGPVYNVQRASTCVFTYPNYGVNFISEEAPDFAISYLDRLKASVKADHMYYACGDEEGLRRSSCTPGTRVAIIEFIIRWATDTSSGSEPIYWLSGQAGAGKTTIAYTIALHFETLGSDGNSNVILGGSFFCSRQFVDTRSASSIIRTIVYQLALRSKAFRAALKEHGVFETVDHGPRSQIMGLLVEPWIMSAPARLGNNEPCYVVAIDALDELEGTGGMDFLIALFDVLQEEDLSGLKFFLTSTPEPALVQRIASFPNKQVCRLEEVPLEESSADIRLYLNERLGEFATSQQIQQLVLDAAGLFLYAATTVEYLQARAANKQKSLLQQLLAPSSAVRYPARGATARLDSLYLQILDTSLVDPRDDDDPDVFQDCLSILHTFFCTTESTSTVVAVGILNGGRNNWRPLWADDALGILDRLYAVLYSQGGQVMWFHKSFADFLFDKSRSQRFFCNQEQHHGRLAEGCFGIMSKELRFNIADIASSYQLDRDNPALPTAIETNVSAPLRYACGNWSAHLVIAPREALNRFTECLHKFLPLEILFWMESMNLLGLRGRCQGMLRDAQQWVCNSEGQADLVSKLADAASFALYHSTSRAALSTPHLYISSLATFHRRSDLVQRWKQELGGIPTFTSGHQTVGEALMASFVTGNDSTAFAVSPDGENIASGSANGSVGLWVLATGEEVTTFRGYASPIVALAYSPGGAHLVAGSDDKLVRVWDLSSGEVMQTFKGHSGGVRAVAYSPDSDYVASGSYDKSVRLWDLSSGTEARAFRGHDRRVCAVAFSPDGNHVVSGSDDGLALVWSLSTGDLLATFSGHGGGVQAVAFSPDGCHVVSGSSDQTLRVWGWSTGDEMMTFRGHTGPVCALAYAPSGTLIVSGSSDRSIRVWDVSAGRVVNTLDGHRGGVCAVAYSGDGTHIFSGSTDQSVRVWDSLASLGKEAALKGHVTKVNSLAYSPSDNHVVCGMDDASVWVWNLSSGELLKSLKGHTLPVRAVAYSPDGAYAASGSDDESVRVWDLSTGEEWIILEGHEDKIWAVAYSPDGTSVASASSDKSVRLWALARGEEVAAFFGHTDWVQTVAYSPRGSQLASGSKDRTVMVWDLDVGRAVHTLRGHLDAVTAVAYSPNGMHVVSASEDQTVRVWDLDTGAGVSILVGHAGGVTAVCCSPDGEHVVSGSNDKSMRIWDLATGAQVKALKGHTDVITAVAYSPNGNHVVSCSLDTSVRVWDISAQHSQRYILEKGLDGEYTGWLLSPTDRSAHVMFVPPETLPPNDANVLTLPTSIASCVDFSAARLGHGWADCFTSISV